MWSNLVKTSPKSSSASFASTKFSNNISAWSNLSSFSKISATSSVANYVHSAYQIRGKKTGKTLKVIFTKDIPHIKAIAGQEKEVPRGFARNHLIPSKLAVYYSLTNRESVPAPDPKLLEEFNRRERLREAAKKLAKITVRVKRQVMPDGSLHSAVTPDIVCEKMMKQHKIRLFVDQIILPQNPLGTVGAHQAKVLIEGAELPLNLYIAKR